MPDLSQNVRYLLWRKEIPRAEWTSKLTALLGWAEANAEAFLAGDSGALSDTELKTIARFGGVTEADLTTKDLLVAANRAIFHENLSFLIDLLPHGEKKRFATELGVDATTISRWKNGAQEPTKRKVSAIIRYFQLDDETDLRRMPVFLSQAPVGANEMRAWLHQRIDSLSVGALRDLQPALTRLLAKR